MFLLIFSRWLYFKNKAIGNTFGEGLCDGMSLLGILTICFIIYIEGGG
jgi:hypothetical protein